MSDAPVLNFQPEGTGLHVDLEKLVASRLLIQGSSGAGKSWLIRYLLEQTHGKIQQFVFDPEGEFSTLRAHFDYVVASAGGDGDVPAHPDTAALLCEQLVDLEASAILDIYDLDPEERQEFVGNFLRRLVNLPKGSWRPALVVVDEAHEFAPETEKTPARKPMELIVSKGRKRGLCAVYSTQRLSKLSKNASDLQNMLIGYTGLDVDVRRAGDMLGFDRRQQQELKQLEHEFFAFGPAFSREVTRVRSGRVQTHHPKAGEIRPPTPPPKGKLAKLVAQLSEIPERAAEEERTIEALEARVRELRDQLARAGELGPTEEEIDARIREAEERARTAAAAAIEELRTEARTPLEQLQQMLMNGRAPVQVTTEIVDRETGATVSRSERTVSPRRIAPPPPPKSTSPLPSAWHRILDALASLEVVGVKAPFRENVAVFARMSPRSSAYQGHVGKMTKAGLLEQPVAGCIALSDEGRRVGVPNRRPRSVRELHNAWLEYLTNAEGRILSALLDAHPEPIPREELAGRAGQSWKSSAYQGHVGHLAGLGLLNYPRAGVVALSDLLFPMGLR